MCCNGNARRNQDPSIPNLFLIPNYYTERERERKEKITVIPLIKKKKRKEK